MREMAIWSQASEGRRVKSVEARLTLARTSPNDIKQRQVIVKLDGERIAVLLYGQTVTRAIQPGSHRIAFDNTWARKKLEFRIGEGEHTTYNVINRTGRLTWWMVATLGAGPIYLTIEEIRQPAPTPNS